MNITSWHKEHVSQLSLSRHLLGRAAAEGCVKHQTKLTRTIGPWSPKVSIDEHGAHHVCLSCGVGESVLSQFQACNFSFYRWKKEVCFACILLVFHQCVCARVISSHLCKFCWKRSGGCGEERNNEKQQITTVKQVLPTGSRPNPHSDADLLWKPRVCKIRNQCVSLWDPVERGKTKSNKSYL